MKNISDHAASIAAKTYTILESKLAERLTCIHWRLSDVATTKYSVPKTAESAIEHMTDALRGSGVFIRALKNPNAEKTLLCPGFIPTVINQYVVPQQKANSASLWVSGAQQHSYNYSPYLIFANLSAKHVLKMADRDLIQERSARQFGPGYSQNLAEGKQKLAQEIRARGGDVYVSGPFFVHSDVNESIVSYGPQDITGVGVRSLSHAEMQAFESALRDGISDTTPEYVQQYIQAIALADRLEAVTGRPIPIVAREADDTFTPIHLSAEIKTAIRQMPQAPEYVAQASVMIRMAVKAGLLGMGVGTC